CYGLIFLSKPSTSVDLRQPARRGGIQPGDRFKASAVVSAGFVREVLAKDVCTLLWVSLGEARTLNQVILQCYPWSCGREPMAGSFRAVFGLSGDLFAGFRRRRCGGIRLSGMCFKPARRCWRIRRFTRCQLI